MSGVKRATPAMLIALLGYIFLWACSTAYLGLTGADWVTPVLIFVIFGCVLSGIGWLLTRGANAPAIPVERPAVESIALLAFMLVYAVGFLGYGMTAARDAVAAGREQELLVLGLKLVVHLAIPVVILLLLRARIAPIFQAGLSGRKFWRTLLVLGIIILGLLSVVSPSISEIAGTGASAVTLAWVAPATLIWIMLEAGLTEEFLFRGVLQTRLSAWSKSPWIAVAATSILFALAHVPGLYLRGGPDTEGWSNDPVQVIAYTVAMLSPISITLGFIYMRTKSLLLVVLLHSLIDLLPGIAEFYRAWAA